MNLKVSFLKSIKACLQSNNLHTLSEILPNYVYYPLTKDELYLVCFGFHKIKNFIQSNALIEQAKNSVSDDSLQQQYTRLEIFNYFFLSNFDKTKELVLQFLASSFDEEVIKIFYLSCKSIDDYNFFLSKTKKVIEKHKFNLQSCSKLIDFLKQNQEFEVLGFLLIRLFKNDKKNINLLYTIARNYFSLKKYYLAKIYYIKIIKLAPDSNLFLDIAILCNYLRQKEEYKKYISKALVKDPKNIKAITLLTSIDKEKSKYSSNIQMLEEISNTELDDASKTILYFTIANIYEKQNNYSKASQYIEKANFLKNKNLHFSIERVKKEGDFFLENFHDAKIPVSKDLQNIDKTPIFIIGLPRSGTTLVEHILGSHQRVQHFGETNYFFKNFKLFIDVYDLEKNQNILKNYTEQDYLKYGKRYMDYFSLLKNKTHFTDKMPFNFFYISLIKKTIPHSKIIFCSRDYCDIGLSIYKNDFALNLDFAYDQKNIIDYVTAFDSIMKQWKNRLGLEIHEIKYEDLIRDPETHVSSLLDFCNLEFDQDCLHFYKKQLSSDTVSTNQVTNNFYDSSIGVWKNYYPYYKSFFDSLLQFK
jgi:tetratricopeptide (TPR) repeat protein